ncbi:MAG: hypothetical protein KDF63_11790, partial [Rhodoferax sp.]|nr:hypothetical protein [Rhodoferax sp.]
EVLRGFAARQGVVGLKLSVQACDALPASVRGRSGKLQRIVARGGAAARKGGATADHRMRSRRAQRAA